MNENEGAVSEEWPLSVYPRIAVECAFYSTFTLLILWFIFRFDTGMPPQPRGIILAILTLAIFAICGFLPSHIAITLGRAGTLLLVALSFVSSVAPEFV